jgi:hypothetical protein
MSMHPQNRFPRLAIVGAADKKPQQQSAGLRWWGPPSPRRLSLQSESPTTQGLPYPNRMTVMPTLPRSFVFAAIDRLRDILRDYFVTELPRRGSAAVLSFRRGSAQAHGFRRPIAEDGCASKKASGSVWRSDREVTPQEGGRR